MQDPHHPDTHLETVHVTVSGKVQGVGYRHATVRRAHLLGARGWVQNMEDGTVEALVQGTPDQVDHMLEWLRRARPAPGWPRSSRAGSTPTSATSASNSCGTAPPRRAA